MKDHRSEVRHSKLLSTLVLCGVGSWYDISDREQRDLGAQGSNRWLLGTPPLHRPRPRPRHGSETLEARDDDAGADSTDRRRILFRMFKGSAPSAIRLRPLVHPSLPQHLPMAKAPWWVIKWPPGCRRRELFVDLSLPMGFVQISSLRLARS